MFDRKDEGRRTDDQINIAGWVAQHRHRTQSWSREWRVFASIMQCGRAACKSQGCRRLERISSTEGAAHRLQLVPDSRHDRAFVLCFHGLVAKLQMNGIIGFRNKYANLRIRSTKTASSCNNRNNSEKRPRTATNFRVSIRCGVSHQEKPARRKKERNSNGKSQEKRRTAATNCKSSFPTRSLLSGAPSSQPRHGHGGTAAAAAAGTNGPSVRVLFQEPSCLAVPSICLDSFKVLDSELTHLHSM